MVEKIDAIDRAKRALNYDLPFPGDTIEQRGVPSELKGIIEESGMPTTRTIDAAGRIVKEILEAEKVVRQEEQINWKIDTSTPYDRVGKRELAITLEHEQCAIDEESVRIEITVPNDLALLIEALRSGKPKIQFVVTLEEEWLRQLYSS